MSGPEFVYTIHVDATPQRVWHGLTEPDCTRRYWYGMAFQSDWQVGSPVLLQFSPDDEFEDIGHVVLESEPHRRLAYRWHRFQRSHAELFGWSDVELARNARERPSRVAFDIEPRGGDGTGAWLTIVHDDFDPDSLMYRAISGQLEGSGGWPGLMARMKSLLESGQVTA